MTGFGSAQGCLRSGALGFELRVDIKSLNSRFLDLALRTPKGLAAFEPDMARFLRARLKRGRVDVNVYMKQTEGPSPSVTLDHGVLRHLYQQLEAFRASVPMAEPVRLSDLLHFEELVTRQQEEVQGVFSWDTILPVFSEALDGLVAERRREGEHLESLLKEHHAKLLQGFEAFVMEVPRLLKEQKMRWRERLDVLIEGQRFSEERLEQEFVLWLGRSDFQEELDRLKEHLRAFQEALAGQTSAKQLEFLTQELQREVNTLGAKCSDGLMIHRIVEMKTTIERIREQLQNGE